jgi:hypothetical protein
MTDFKAGDLVRIGAPSTGINSHIAMVGLEGYIEEIVGDNAQFMELRANGDCGGGGGVPLACLQLKNDDVRLQRFMQEKNEASAKRQKESDAFLLKPARSWRTKAKLSS